MNALLAVAGEWTIERMAIAALIILGICAVVWVVVTQVFKLQFPQWLLWIIGIILGVVIGVWAIKFIAAQA